MENNNQPKEITLGDGTKATIIPILPRNRLYETTQDILGEIGLRLEVEKSYAEAFM